MAPSEYSFCPEFQASFLDLGCSWIVEWSGSQHFSCYYALVLTRLVPFSLILGLILALSTLISH